MLRALSSRLHTVPRVHRRLVRQEPCGLSEGPGCGLQRRLASTQAEAYDETADYVVVGAGSAGCVLANRLSEDGTKKVLLLEYGPSDRGHPSALFIHMPTGLSIPMNSERYNWGYQTVAEPGLGGRVLDAPRGKCLGGSSSINGMVFVRGHPEDFNHWAEDHACAGWTYDRCLPYFKRMETWAGGADEHRGGSGPLHTTTGPLRNPLYKAFIAAGREAGYGAAADYNGARQEGFGPMAMTVNRGVRASTANEFLRPAMARPNLKVVTEAMAKRVVFDGSKTAVGVEYLEGGAGGRTVRVKADAEVILSAGAFGSPHLLQMSGVGDPEHLASLGVRCVHALPGVGGNLQDHLELLVQHHCNLPVSLYNDVQPLGKLRIGVQWLLARSGLGATNHFEAAGFIRSRAGERYPDIQYHFVPLAVRYDGRSAVEGHGFQAHCGPMRSKSRGHVRARSANPWDPPEVRFNYLTHPEDMEEWRRCLRLTREILAQPAMDAFRGEEIQPGPDVQSDEAVDAAVREHVESAYHPCGTCKMGGGAALDVVSPSLQVHGMQRLRVIDSSIMPRITNGNLNGPTIMIAERGADMILGRSLPPDPAPYYVAPDWETRQRESAPQRPTPM